MHTLIIVLHVFVALFLILVVLLQTGKGASMGSAFGGGASQTMFGSAGAGNFLTKLTTAAAIVFMITSLALTTLASKKDTRSIVKETAEESAPKPGAPSGAMPATTK